MWTAETEVMVSQLCLMCGRTLNCQTLFLGAHVQYKLVVDEDVKKSNKQTNKPVLFLQSSKAFSHCCQLKNLQIMSMPENPASLSSGTLLLSQFDVRRVLLKGCSLLASEGDQYDSTLVGRFGHNLLTYQNAAV